MNQIEHKEQCALMKWWHLSHNRFGTDEILLFAIPNGGRRDVATASNLKAEGVRAGVPDLFLAVPAFGHHGLFIEMKREKGGIVSDFQKEYIALLNERGYKAIVCHGWIEAKNSIESYLEGA